MIFIIVLIQILVVLLLLKIFNSFLKPPVFLSIVWLIPLLFLMIIKFIDPNSFQLNGYGLIFPFGCLIFSIGYRIFDKNKQVIDKNYIEGKKITFIFKMFIIVELILVILWFINVKQYVNANFKYNFWYTYKWGVSKEDYFDPFYIPYLRTATRVISCLMLVNFLKLKSKQESFWFLFQLLITFLLNFIGQGRGGIFSLILPMCIIYLILCGDSRKKIIIMVSFTLIILISVFFIYGSMKNPYTENQDKSVFLSLENYMCGGIISFCEWATKTHELGYGIFTFRFVNALLNGIGFEVNVVSMVEEYVVNIHGNVGNVYTFYKWYANDFGIIYALFVQFILGIIYGWLAYKTRIKNSSNYVVFYALMFYPLFMQFFNDQYFSNFSIWIQMTFWILLIGKSNVFMRKVNNMKEIKEHI